MSVRSEILKSASKISSKASLISFGCILARKPSLPVLIPTIGIFKSLTRETALSMVPSPPRLINKLKVSSNFQRC